MTSTTQDAQTWVFPPAGAATPPVAATSNFGPVHYQDSMILNWNPASAIPTVIMTCFTTQGNFSSWYISQGGIQAPFTHKFSEQANLTSSTDQAFCHLYFTPSIMGNTVVFQYDNSAQAKAVTWGAAAEASSTSSSTSSTSSSSSATKTDSSTTSAVSSTITGSTSSAPPNSSSTQLAANSNNSGGLSSGASAGIGVGVAIAVIALVAIGGFLFWRRRRRRGTLNTNAPTEYVSEIDGAPANSYRYEKPLTEARPAELSTTGYGRTAELP